MLAYVEIILYLCSVNVKAGNVGGKARARGGPRKIRITKL
jgi:hypothetical protein